jgi:4-hydroxy-tetrahydrodipicolinate reductase
VKKIGLLGASGRMGQMIAAEIGRMTDICTLAAAPLRGKSEDAFTTSDVVIDFSAPESLEHHAALAYQHGRALVVGTTGLTDAHMAALETAAKKAPVLHAPNTSLGVTLLLSLVEQVAARLNDEYDIEIFESHHRHKIDAPSGTALALGHAAATGRGVKLDDALVPARFGQIGARAAGQIGMSVFRGGDVVGEHTVTFAGIGERLELTHKASDRSLFAKGAVRAALFLSDKPAGMYSMRDVLGL